MRILLKDGDESGGGGGSTASPNEARIQLVIEAPAKDQFAGITAATDKLTALQALVTSVGKSMKDLGIDSFRDLNAVVKDGTSGVHDNTKALQANANAARNAAAEAKKLADTQKPQRRVAAVAVRLGKEIQTGPIHDIARERLIERLNLRFDDPKIERLEHGFLDNYGKFLSREAAFKLAQKNQQLTGKIPDKVNWLDAENLVTDIPSPPTPPPPPTSPVPQQPGQPGYPVDKRTYAPGSQVGEKGQITSEVQRLARNVTQKVAYEEGKAVPKEITENLEAERKRIDAEVTKAYAERQKEIDAAADQMLRRQNVSEAEIAARAKKRDEDRAKQAVQREAEIAENSKRLTENQKRQEIAAENDVHARAVKLDKDRRNEEEQARRDAANREIAAENDVHARAKLLSKEKARQEDVAHKERQKEIEEQKALASRRQVVSEGEITGTFNQGQKREAFKEAEIAERARAKDKAAAEEREREARAAASREIAMENDIAKRMALADKEKERQRKEALSQAERDADHQVKIDQAEAKQILAQRKIALYEQAKMADEKAKTDARVVNDGVKAQQEQQKQRDDYTKWWEQQIVKQDAIKKRAADADARTDQRVVRDGVKAQQEQRKNEADANKNAAALWRIRQASRRSQAEQDARDAEASRLRREKAAKWAERRGGTALREELFTASSEFASDISGLSRSSTPHQDRIQEAKARASKAQREADAYERASHRAHAAGRTEDAEKLALKHAKALETVAQANRHAANETARLNEHQRYIGKNMLQNVAHVTAWSAAVGTLYGSLRLVRSGVGSMIELEHQTARLSQVFRGGQVEARHIADDIMRLAANNGRATSEAMESAIQWSRLGLNRKQVNDAVRVSLMAANVAEITAAESTEHLSAIMAAYKLNVSDLSVVLGEMNAISNTFNVTNKDMLDGISRTGAIAAQANIPLAELMGLLGAGVGKTGQTGANVGNAIKSMLGALSDKNVQRNLREGFQFEATSLGGEGLKSTSEIIAELFVKFQSLNEVTRQSMIFSSFGKNQASRITAILDNYVTAQTLAITAQLNLNSAEKENAKIKATMKSQLAGLVAEWERFVSIQGSGFVGGGALNAMTESTKALHNVLRLANTSVGGGIAQGIGGLLAVVAAKMVLTSVAMTDASKKGGMLVETMKAIRQAGKDVVNVSDQLVTRTRSGFFGGFGIGQEMFTRLNEKGKNMMDPNRSLVGGVVGPVRDATTGMKALGAATRFAAVAGTALVDAFLPLAALAGAVWLFNRGMEALGLSSDKAEDSISKLVDKQSEAQSVSNAADQTRRLFSTISSAVQTSYSPQGKSAMLGQAADISVAHLGETEEAKRLAAARRESFEQLLKANDMQAISVKLTELSVEAEERRLKKRREARQAQAEQNIQMQAEVARLKLSPFGSSAKIQEFESKIAANREKSAAALLEDLRDNNEAAKDFAQHSQQHAQWLGKQAGILASIRDLYKQIAGESSLEKLQSEISANRDILGLRQKQIDLIDEDVRKRGIAPASETSAELSLLTKKYENMLVVQKQMESMRFSVEDQWAFDQSEYDTLLKNIEEVSNAMDAVEKRQARSSTDDSLAILARRNALQEEYKNFLKEQAELEERVNAAKVYDRRAIAISYAQAEGKGTEFGMNDVDTLLNSISGLQKLRDANLARANAVKGTVEAENALIAAQQQSMMLEKARGELAVKPFELKKRELQAQLDLNKAIMTSTPGEMLRKLALSKMTGGGRKNLSVGELLALDPSSRQELMPGMEARAGINRVNNALGIGQPGGAGNEASSLDAIKAENERRKARNQPILPLDVGLAKQQLRNEGKTLPGEGNVLRNVQQGAEREGDWRRKFLGGLAEPMRGMAEAAGQTATRVSELGGQADAAARNLQTLTGAVAALSDALQTVLGRNVAFASPPMNADNPFA